jgi:hypothetical protein
MFHGERSELREKYGLATYRGENTIETHDRRYVKECP